MGSIPGMSGDMRLLGGIHRRQAKIYAKLQKGLEGHEICEAPGKAQKRAAP